MSRSKVLSAFLFLLFAGLPTFANDLRVWTSRKGSSIEAKLLKLDDGQVQLVTKETKVIKVDVGDLSLADRQHLVEFAGADRKILSEIELGIPEKEARIGTKDFKRLEEKFSLDDQSEGDFDLLETEHFLVATNGKVRPQGLAEMAERVWHGMAFQHMNFREDWGDKRMLLIATTENDTYEQMGKWYVALLKERGMAEQAGHMTQMWSLAASSTIALPDSLAEKYNLHPRARTYNVKNESSYRRVFSPFPTHTLAGALLHHQLGGVSDFGSKGYFALTTGHSYYKEIQLAGKTETSLLNQGDYDNDEIATTRGFEDGTSWARTLKKMVRKGDVKPDLEKMLQWSARDLTPEGLVTIYSFAYYLESTPERLSAFAALVRRIETSDQVPDLADIAKIYGFDSVEAFQNDWIEFIKSTNFK